MFETFKLKSKIRGVKVITFITLITILAISLLILLNRRNIKNYDSKSQIQNTLVSKTTYPLSYQVETALSSNTILMLTKLDTNSVKDQINSLRRNFSSISINFITPSHLVAETYNSDIEVKFNIQSSLELSTIKINDISIKPQSDQNYSLKYHLSSENNHLNISAVDDSGYTKSYDLQIKKTPNVISNFPILMYHHILEVQPDSNYLSSKDFNDQLDYLKNNGYNSISFKELNDYLISGNPISSKGIILSFDDGYIDAYTKAFPLLLKYDFKASFGIVTKNIGHSDIMSWDQLHDLVNARMEIVSHSYSHNSMKLLSINQLENELKGSKETLENVLSIKVKTFIYPSGEFNNEVITQLKRYGYESARTTKYSSNISKNDMYRLPTIRISKGNTSKFLLKYLPY